MQRKKIRQPRITKSMVDHSIFSVPKKLALIQRYKSRFVVNALSRHLGRPAYTTDLHDLDINNFFQDDIAIKKGSQLIGVALFSTIDSG